MSDSSEDSGPSCEAGCCVNSGEQYTPCCHVPLCDEHYDDLIHQCHNCDSEWCETCIDYGNGYICSKCKNFVCYDCERDDNVVKCKC